MIENTVAKYLDERMNVPVNTERKKTVPKEYILIELTGSTKYDHCLRTDTIAVRAISTSLAKAASLLQKAEKILDVMPESVTNVSKADMVTDYNNTNTVLNIYRYQAVYQISYHE